MVYCTIKYGFLHGEVRNMRAVEEQSEVVSQNQRVKGFLATDPHGFSRIRSKTFIWGLIFIRVSP